MFDASFFQPTASGAQTSADSDAGLIVVFSREPVQNDAKSEISGRPIFDDVEMVTILKPDSRDIVGPRPVTDVDRRRFSVRYAEYRKADAQVLEGTPVEQWPALSKIQVHELRAFGIRTVEQLAGLADAGPTGPGGTGHGLAPELIARAQAFLDHARDGATVERLAAENTRLKADLITAHAENRRLGALVAADQE